MVSSFCGRLLMFVTRFRRRTDFGVTEGCTFFLFVLKYLLRKSLVFVTLGADNDDDDETRGGSDGNDAGINVLASGRSDGFCCCCCCCS